MDLDFRTFLDTSRLEIAGAVSSLAPHVPPAMIDEAEILLRDSADRRQMICEALAFVDTDTHGLSDAQRTRLAAVAATALHLALLRLERRQ